MSEASKLQMNDRYSALFFQIQPCFSIFAQINTEILNNVFYTNVSSFLVP